MSRLKKTETADTAAPPLSPEEQLVAILPQLDDANLAQRIASNKERMAQLVAPLKKENEILQRCRTILRGKRLAEGKKRGGRSKKTDGEVVAPPAGPPDVSLRDRVLARLQAGPGRLEAISEECKGHPDQVLGILQSLARSKQATQDPKRLLWSAVHPFDDRY